MNFEILTSLRSSLAEGPLFHPEENKVYWTDIDGGLLHRIDPDTLVVETVHQGTSIGGFTIQDDGSLLLFRKGGAIECFRNGTTSVLFDSLPDEEETRFNDVAADPEGRVFCGTMPTEHRAGRLYRLDSDGSIRIVVEDVRCSNGIGWSPDLSVMYFTDTGRGSIFAYDYDRASGEMSDRRLFFKLDTGGAPDGMTVDSEGTIWTGVWGGGVLIRIDPVGQEVERFSLPAKKITCPTFGGAQLEDLYVTAAGGKGEGEGEGAGELMRLRPGVKGKPEFRSRIKIGVDL